jgi:hypothetical protein
MCDALRVRANSELNIILLYGPRDKLQITFGSKKSLERFFAERKRTQSRRLVAQAGCRNLHQEGEQRVKKPY